MFVIVSAANAELREPADTKALKVVLASGVTPDHASAVLAGGGLGRVADHHAWLSIEALRAAAVVDGGSSAERFDAMIAYAEKSGWVDGTEIRAHIEEQTGD